MKLLEASIPRMVGVLIFLIINEILMRLRIHPLIWGLHFIVLYVLTNFIYDLPTDYLGFPLPPPGSPLYYEALIITDFISYAIEILLIILIINVTYFLVKEIRYRLELRQNP